MAAGIKNNKQKNQILDNAYLEDEFFEDVKLLGIVSASEYYRLISFINQRLGLHFSRNHDLEIRLNEITYPV
ncbi:MAG: hypothetical protein IT257_10205, partial [Chitinophagaceae bacterium]|nr:hypothetical protein [Chitinophagaceae bacterium]